LLTQENFGIAKQTYSETKIFFVILCISDVLFPFLCGIIDADVSIYYQMVLPCCHLGPSSAGSGEALKNQDGYQPLPGNSTSVGLL